MRLGRIGVAAGLLLLAGCADLGDLNAGTCGNGILEPGEDCDAPHASCGVPESQSECRYVCEKEEDCPSNHHCGLDQICRRGTGSFEALTTIPGELLTDARLGDFDADGRADLVSVNQSGRLEVSYMSATGVAATSTFQTSSLPLAVAQLTDGDSRTDVVHLPNLQVGVLRALSGRTLGPTAYSPIPIPEQDARFFVLEGKYPAAGEFNYYGGQEILQFSGNQIKSIAGPEVEVFQVPYSAQDAIPYEREIATGNLDARIQSPCDEFVLTKFEADRVSVYTPCAGGLAWNHDANALPPVMMPAGEKVGFGALIAHADGDEFLDLLIAGTSYPNPSPAPGKPEEDVVFDLYVAFGAGDGTFHDGAGNVGVARVMLHGLARMPLAARDLTSDGIVDLVIPKGIVASQDCSTLLDCWVVLEVQQANWSRAIVDDFNANGYADVVAITDNSRYVDFLNGTVQQNGIFNQYRVPTAGAPFQLAKGDFDGDLLPDVAISETDDSTTGGIVEGDSPTPASPQQQDSLSILFGKSQGAPEPPINMGRLNRIEFIATGQFWFQGGADYVSDLGVLSRDDEAGTRSVALFTGATNRQLQSPFVLTNSASGDSDLGVTVAAGAFSGEAHPDVAALGILGADDVSQRHARLWMLESTGEAALAQSKAKPSSTNIDELDIDPCTLSIVPLDVEGDGVEELALLGRPKNSEEDGGRILVAHANGGSWELGNVVTVDARFANALEPRFICQALRLGLNQPNPNGDFEDRSLLQVTDYDGDGQRELLSLTRKADLGTHRLSVFPVTPELGTSPREIVLPSDMDTLGFRAIDADADPEQEFVLVTYGAVYLADLDVGAQALVNLQLLAGTDIGDLPVPGTKEGPGASTGLSFFSWVLAIVDGDFNGDGLSDFAVAHNSGIDVFLAQAVRP
jgi:hypothetical protein